MEERQVQSLGQEDPLEEEMATHSSILSWRILWTEDLGGLHTVHGVAESQTRRNMHADREIHTYVHTYKGSCRFFSAAFLSCSFKQANKVLHMKYSFSWGELRE